MNADKCQLCDGHAEPKSNFCTAHKMTVEQDRVLRRLLIERGIIKPEVKR